MGRKVIIPNDSEQKIHADLQTWGKGDTACGILSSERPQVVNSVITCEECMRVLTAAKSFTCIGNGWV